MYIDDETATRIKKELKSPDIRYVEFGGDMFFWSDVRSVERVKIPEWLDELLFKSGQITKKENQKKVLKELTRRKKIGSKFHGVDDVFSFLVLNQ